jgi:Ankyrin repeats (3 copies)
MSLSSLPREIVLEIADYFTDVGVNALACTNIQVYNFLNVHLYRLDVTKPQSKSLTWAAELGVEGTVKRAVYSSRHFNPVPESLHIALLHAVDQGHVHLVQLLMRVDNINLNFGGDLLEFEGSPLCLAAKRGHTAIVELLLVANDVDPNIGNESSLTPCTGPAEWAMSLL